ncbi:MAG: hypothetical protein WD555_03970 [Fulvivirga sp.]
MSLSSCFNDSQYYPFSEKELDFVSYEEGQTLKFIDTSGITHILMQNKYKHKFDEVIGIYGSYGYSEEYEVSYTMQNSATTWHNVYLATGLQSILNIDLWGFGIYTMADPPGTPRPLEVSYASLTIADKTYVNVYAFKASKQYGPQNTRDTATLFWNREYGAIQLLFPNGKTITRVD